MNGYNIPYPITINEVLSRNISKSVRSKGVLIDELDMILPVLCSNIPIYAVSITKRDFKSLAHDTAETNSCSLTVKDVLPALETRYIYM